MRVALGWLLALLALVPVAVLVGASSRDAEAGPGSHPESRPAAKPSSPAIEEPAAGRTLAPRDAGELRALVHWCRAATAAEEGALRRMASESADAMRAGNAIQALGRLRLIGPDDPLLELLHDPRLRVRQELVVALGKSGDERARSILRELSRDPELAALVEHASLELRGAKARAR